MKLKSYSLTNVYKMAHRMRHWYMPQNADPIKVITLMKDKKK
jgi:hypothetical protein